MSPRANIRDIDALSDLKAAFGRFGDDVSRILPGIHKELERIQERLQERQTHWQHEVNEAHGLVDATRRALMDCESDSEDEEGNPPDCCCEAEQFSDAQRRLVECEENLETIRLWQLRIESQIDDFKNELFRLSHLASAQGAFAQAFLADKISALDRYVEGVSPQVWTTDLHDDCATDNIRVRSALTAPEKQALLKYSGPEYHEINDQLRRGASDEVTKRRTDLISQALQKLPAYQGVVYRGASQGAYAAKYMPGKIVKEDAFISASRAANAVFPGDIVFVIQSKTGRDIARFAKHPQEEEVLFDHGTQFKVLSRTEVSRGSCLRTEITLEEI